jgi:hypothetical protein
MMKIQQMSGTILLLLLAVYDSMAPPGQEGHNDPFNYNWFKPDSDEQIAGIVGTSNPAPQTHPTVATEPAQNAEPQGQMVGSGFGDTSGLASITGGGISQSAPPMAPPMQLPTVGQGFHGSWPEFMAQHRQQQPGNRVVIGGGESANVVEGQQQHKEEPIFEGGGSTQLSRDQQPQGQQIKILENQIEKPDGRSR